MVFFSSAAHFPKLNSLKFSLNFHLSLRIQWFCFCTSFAVQSKPGITNYKLQIWCFDKTEWGSASPWDVLLFLKPNKLYTQSLNNPRSCHRAEFFSEWRKKSGFDLTATVPQPHCQGAEICCLSLEPGLHVFLEVEFGSVSSQNMRIFLPLFYLRSLYWCFQAMHFPSLAFNCVWLLSACVCYLSEAARCKTRLTFCRFL